MSVTGIYHPLKRVSVDLDAMWSALESLPETPWYTDFVALFTEALNNRNVDVIGELKSRFTALGEAIDETSRSSEIACSYVRFLINSYEPAFVQAPLPFWAWFQLQNCIEAIMVKLGLQSQVAAKLLISLSRFSEFHEKLFARWPELKD